MRRFSMLAACGLAAAALLLTAGMVRPAEAPPITVQASQLEMVSDQLAPKLHLTAFVKADEAIEVRVHPAAEVRHDDREGFTLADVACRPVSQRCAVLGGREVPPVRARSTWIV